MEKEYFSAGGVRVTSSLADFGNTSYPIANIGAVSVEITDKSNIGAIITFAVIGLIAMAFGGFGVLIGLGTWAFAVYIIFKNGLFTTTHHVELRTSSGNVQAYSSKDKNEVEKIRAAILNAITDRG